MLAIRQTVNVGSGSISDIEAIGAAGLPRKAAAAAGDRGFWRAVAAATRRGRALAG